MQATRKTKYRQTENIICANGIQRAIEERIYRASKNIKEKKSNEEYCLTGTKETIDIWINIELAKIENQRVNLI